MFYLETGSLDPCYNLAFEEYVLNSKTEGDWLILWQNANTVVVGLNQTAEEEINREYIESHNVKVVRRKTGGGAVYHDMGNLNYSFICDSGPYEEISMKRFTDPICRALGSMGINAASSGRNDITVDGRKVSGTAQRLNKNRILHHGTLLISSDAEAIAGALKADPDKFKSKSTKSVRARVGNISDILGRDISVDEIKSILMRELGADGLVKCSLTDEEIQKVTELSENYRSWEWTYGRSPKYGYTNKKRFEGGTLGVSADIKSGVIENIVFFGDFMAVTDITDAEQALTGLRFERETIASALRKLDIQGMFGKITEEDILEVMFP